MQALIVANAAVTLMLVGLILTIQVVHYPLFARVGAAGFAAYEAAHSARITVLVMPLMGLEVLLSIAIGGGDAGLDPALERRPRPCARGRRLALDVLPTGSAARDPRPRLERAGSCDPGRDELAAHRGVDRAGRTLHRVAARDRGLKRAGYSLLAIAAELESSSRNASAARPVIVNGSRVGFSE